MNVIKNKPKMNFRPNKHENYRYYLSLLQMSDTIESTKDTIGKYRELPTWNYMELGLKWEVVSVKYVGKVVSAKYVDDKINI